MMAASYLSLGSLNIRTESQLYSTPYETAFHGVEPSTNRPVLVFVRRYTSAEKAAVALALSEKHAENHEESLLWHIAHNAVSLGGSNYELATVTESCEQSISADIAARRASGTPYEESYLRFILKRFIASFARLQLSSISPAVVSPMSLFITAQGVKLGTLSAPESIEEFLMSPAKKVSVETGRTLLAENHYKSGVFMLGATLLEMALLRTPELGTVATLKECIERELAEVRLSQEFIERLRLMLEIHDISRPDFISLNRCHLQDFPFSEEPSDTLPAPTLPSPSLPTSAQCLQCGADLGEERKMLWCNPLSHGFCRWKCAELYTVTATSKFTLDVSKVSCSKCGTEISRENLEECMGGAANLERLIKETLYEGEICVSCRILGEPVFQLKCGCWYCKGDIRTLAEKFYNSNQCPSCSNKLDFIELQTIAFPKK